MTALRAEHARVKGGDMADQMLSIDEISRLFKEWNPDKGPWARYLCRAQLEKAEPALQADIEQLKYIARELHWMARRYADGRQSYVTGNFNLATRALLELGVQLNSTGDKTIWARDAAGRAFDGLTDEEAAMGAQPDWTHDGMQRRNEELEAQVQRLRESLAEMIEVAAVTAYPQPDKPGSAWAKIERARGVLVETDHIAGAGKVILSETEAK